MPPLETAFHSASPRYTPVSTPWVSALIHAGVLLLWLLLFAMAFRVAGVWGWATGLAYVAYDTLLLVFVTWQTRTLAWARDPSLSPAVHPDLGPQPSPGLGVIVAAHNEANVLHATLTALLSQASPPQRIVIADDGSTDHTAAVLLKHYGIGEPAVGDISAASPVAPAVRWLRLPHRGKAAALNSAIEHIDTDIVLTVDSDTRLEPRAIERMRAAFAADPRLVAATGVLTPVCGSSVSARVFRWFQTYEYIRNFLSRYAWMQVNGLLLISGAFAGFRRSALVEVGGFDPDCLVEDYELIHRMRRYANLHQRGWTTAVIGGARASTEAPGDLAAFLRQRRRWFGGFLQTQYWYRDMVGDRRYGWLGLAMLPVKAIDTLQPLYGLTAFFLLLYYLFTGSAVVLLPVAGVISAKIVIDLGFHVWSVHLYRRWVGYDASTPQAGFSLAVLAALIEPFSFQLLRHTGAAWGWWYFLTGNKRWGRKSRSGL